MSSNSSNEPYLKDKYDSAMKLVREGKVGDSVSEKNAGKAYQNLVKAGLAMQIKKKYRRI
jgi:hypothetical protein